MFLCQDCGAVFDAPIRWQETHGLDCGLYEQLSGCPFCSGAYCNTYRCDSCGEWIDDDYVKINILRYCHNCYKLFEPGDED